MRPVVDSYTIGEAAAVLGIRKRRVWELVARGVLSGTPEKGGGMRIFLSGESAAAGPAGTLAAPHQDGNGNGHGNGGAKSVSPDPTQFRELLTEFRSLTERYGQALLALGEARGEVAALKSRVELLEARIDLRLPWSPAATPVTSAWAPPGTEGVAHEPSGEVAPAEASAPSEPPVEVAPAEGAEPVEPPVEVAAAEATPALEAEEAAPDARSAPIGETGASSMSPSPAIRSREQRRRQSKRLSTAGIIEALARAEDPTVTDLPGAEEAATAFAALQREVAAAEESEMPDRERGEIERPMDRSTAPDEQLDHVSAAQAVAAWEQVPDAFLSDDRLATVESEEGEAGHLEASAVGTTEPTEPFEAFEDAGEQMPAESGIADEPALASQTSEGEEQEPAEPARGEVEVAVEPSPAYSSEWDEPDWIAEEDIAEPEEALPAEAPAMASEPAAARGEPVAPPEGGDAGSRPQSAAEWSGQTLAEDVLAPTDATLAEPEAEAVAEPVAEPELEGFAEPVADSSLHGDWGVGTIEPASESVGEPPWLSNAEPDLIPVMQDLDELGVEAEVEDASLEDTHLAAFAPVEEIVPQQGEERSPEVGAGDIATEDVAPAEAAWTDEAPTDEAPTEEAPTEEAPPEEVAAFWAAPLPERQPEESTSAESMGESVPTAPAAVTESAPAESPQAPPGAPSAEGEEELLWLGDGFSAATTARPQAPAALPSPPPVVPERPVSKAEEEALTRLAAERGWDDEELHAIRSLLAQPGQAIPSWPAEAPVGTTAADALGGEAERPEPPVADQLGEVAEKVEIAEIVEPGIGEPIPVEDQAIQPLVSQPLTEGPETVETLLGEAVTPDAIVETAAVDEPMPDEDDFDWERGPTAWSPRQAAPPAVDLPGAAELDEAMAGFSEPDAAGPPPEPDATPDAEPSAPPIWSKYRAAVAQHPEAMQEEPAAFPGGEAPPEEPPADEPREPAAAVEAPRAAEASESGPAAIVGDVRTTPAAGDPRRDSGDWLRGRRGPAANAYRRLRRLFPG